MSNRSIESCEDALRLLAEHLDRELDARTSEQVQRHLETCRSCWSRAEFEARLKQGVAALGTEPVPAELTTRVRTLIDTFAAPGGD